MLTGLRPETFENLQLNAGVFLKNFNHSDIADVDALETAVLAALEAGTDILGATIGGGTFQATPETRSIEVDGMRYQFKGSTIVDSWNIRLTGTMKEITPENFKDALISADITNNGAKKVVRVRTDIEDGDYIPTLCWVGDTSKGAVLIELSNALNTTGANFTFTDKGEGTLPFEFVAHQASLKDSQFAPFQIVFFGEPET